MNARDHGWVWQRARTHLINKAEQGVGVSDESFALYSALADLCGVISNAYWRLSEHKTPEATDPVSEIGK